MQVKAFFRRTNLPDLRLHCGMKGAVVFSFEVAIQRSLDVIEEVGQNSWSWDGVHFVIEPCDRNLFEKSTSKDEVRVSFSMLVCRREEQNGDGRQPLFK
jgi:hypothetical protein